MVLGILIAFQVDEWRSSRKDQLFAYTSLESILLDLEAEYSDSQPAIPTARQSLDSIARLSEMLLSTNPRDEVRITETYYETLIGYAWRQNAPTYSGLRESGEPFLVSDTELRERLFVYYDFGEFVEILENRLGVARDKFSEAARRDFYTLPILGNSSNSSNPLRQTHFVQPVEDMPRHPDYFGALSSYSSRLARWITRMEDLQSRNLALQDFVRARLGK